MTSICIYFQVHQPFRLSKFSFFDIGSDKTYFSRARNKEIFDRVARKCYFPTNNALLRLIDEYDGRFKISYSITGTVLEQIQQFCPEVLSTFDALAETNCVEFLAETYYHSLSFLYSHDEFIEQVNKHSKNIKVYSQKMCSRFFQ